MVAPTVDAATRNGLVYVDLLGGAGRQGTRSVLSSRACLPGANLSWAAPAR
jgi:hypothetical protein